MKKIQATESPLLTQDTGDLIVHCGRNYLLRAGMIRGFFVTSNWLTKRQKSHILKRMEGQNNLAIKV